MRDQYPDYFKMWQLYKTKNKNSNNKYKTQLEANKHHGYKHHGYKHHGFNCTASCTATCWSAHYTYFLFRTFRLCCSQTNFAFRHLSLHSCWSQSTMPRRLLVSKLSIYDHHQRLLARIQDKFIPLYKKRAGNVAPALNYTSASTLTIPILST